MQTILLSALAAAFTASTAVHAYEQELFIRGGQQQLNVRDYDRQPSFLLERDDALLNQRRWLTAREFDDMIDRDYLVSRSPEPGSTGRSGGSGNNPPQRPQQARPQNGNSQGSATAGPQEITGPGSPNANTQGGSTGGGGAHGGGQQTGPPPSLDALGRMLAAGRPGARYLRVTGRGPGQPSHVQQVVPLPPPSPHEQAPDSPSNRRLNGQ